ncbi:unnamed protein product [Effrenium voratum]|uniref:BART domain-containing protein n=1 Tax=Effrenium voratum TaxID=2562239 RepID=A0AA36JSN7_9DINO|nr:unnamed protein product [Effrenium voratum]
MATSIVDVLAQWLESNGISEELDAYIRRVMRQHAACFDSDDEQRHGCFEIFRAYEALLHQLLSDFLQEIRRDAHLAALGGSCASPEQLLTALRAENLAGPRLRAGQLGLLSIASYEDFAAAARRHRAIAQVQADQLLQQLAVQVAAGAELKKS